MIIRKYIRSDLDTIEQIDSFTAIQIKYHKGVHEDNIVCIVNNNSVVGVGFLTLYQTTNTEVKLKIEFSRSIDIAHRDNAEANALLMDGLIQCYNKIKSQNPGIGVYMRVCCETDEIEDMQFFLEKGFNLSAVLPVLKYDLTQKIQQHKAPDNITIQKYNFTEQSMNSYIQAENSSDDNPVSEADIWFLTGDPNFTCFVAMCEGEVVGSISVWNITEERAATENIFVIPAFRKRNIARALISTAFDELKKRGMKIATLSMRGTNLPAMKLYLSCDYSLYYNLLEMVYE